MAEHGRRGAVSITSLERGDHIGVLLAVTQPAVLREGFAFELDPGIAAADDLQDAVNADQQLIARGGKQALVKRNPLINPQFVDEWAKRMRARVNLDEFVDATARVYERYYTSDELDQLTQVQLAMKRSKLYSLPPDLAQKLKTDAPKIQNDINAATSTIGSRLSIAVGQEIEKEHPDWVKPVKPVDASAPKS